MATFTPDFDRNWTPAPVEGQVLRNILTWLVAVFCYFLEVGVLWTSFCWVCLHKNWKPHCTFLMNLAIAKFFSSFFSELLPSLHEMKPTVFSFPGWMQEVTDMASRLGYNASVVLMMVISVERSLALLFRGLFNCFQTKHYSVLCTYLWILVFLLSVMESEFSNEDMETEGVEEKMTNKDVLQYEIENTLVLMNFIAFTVMCSLKIFRNFQEQLHRPYSKQFAAVFLTEDFVLLGLGIALWVQNYENNLFMIIIPDLFLLCNYKKQKGSFRQCFKKTLEKLFCHTPADKQRHGNADRTEV